MTWGRSLPWINPLLAGFLPVLSLYVQNSDQVLLSEAVPSMILVVVGSGLLTVILRLLLRDAMKAGFLVTSWVTLFFSYGHLWDLTAGQAIGGIVIGRPLYLLPAFLAMGLAILLFSALKRRFIAPITSYFSLVFVVLILLSVGAEVHRQIRLSGDTLLELSTTEGLQKGTEQSSALHTPSGFSPNSDLQASTNQRSSMPDIYIIVLDSYARADVLEELYGFDNKQFLDHLRTNGFYVAAESQSNYMTTFLSLSSMLNLEYLQGEETKHLKLFDNRAMWLAKNMGFRTILVPSTWDLSRGMERSNVDLTTRKSLGGLGSMLAGSIIGNEFGPVLIRSTMLGPVIRLKSVGNYINFVEKNRAGVFTNNIEEIKKLTTLEGPKFTFAHFMPPHPPYLFDRDGNVYSTSMSLGADNAHDLYLDQLIWVNKSMETVVDHILEKTKPQPVIVILGDHGPGLLANGDDPYRFKERRSNLVAIHLPASCDRIGLYPTITPVNILRLVFDNCLGTEFGLLEDESFIMKWPRKLCITVLPGRCP